MKKRIIIGVFLSLLVGAGAFVYFGQRAAQKGEAYYSGTIEATQANLAFQVPGRVRTVPVREGQAVSRDQVLAEIDPAEFQSRIDQASANLDKAVKNRQQLETMLDVYTRTLPATRWRMPGKTAFAMIICSRRTWCRKKSGTR